MKKSFFGAALILVGVAILLDRTGVLSLGWKVILWGIVAAAGGLKLYFGLSENRKGPILSGTGLVLLGAAVILDELDVIYLNGPGFLSLLVFALGVAFLLMLVKNPRQWHLAVPAFFCIGIGGVLLCGELGYFSNWEVREFIRHYWPAALVLFGASLLVNRRAV